MVAEQSESQVENEAQKSVTDKKGLSRHQSNPESDSCAVQTSDTNNKSSTNVSTVSSTSSKVFNLLKVNAVSFSYINTIT